MQDNSWLIVGLGNPGPEYAKSRHNIGFRCIDILADKLGVKIDRAKFEGLYGQTEYQGHKLYLLKPLTYMNLSGRSVLQLSSFFKIPPERIIVIFDDISLDPGRLRVRGSGSAGGHNGMKNIILHSGSQDFVRVRVGVGKKPEHMDLADHVLSRFSREDLPFMRESCGKACDALEVILSDGAVAAMNRYNG